jgi:hypothetical protein
MNSWWFGAAYVIGALISARTYILGLQTKVEKDTRSTHTHWHQEPESIFVVLVVAVWPIIAALWLSWKIMFPRGVRTKYSVQRKREARQREHERAVQQMERAARRMLELEAKVAPLAICAGPGDEPTDEQREAAMAYAKAEREFEEACRIVSENRGKPWSIGHLTNVRIRKPRAKATT